MKLENQVQRVLVKFLITRCFLIFIILCSMLLPACVKKKYHMEPGSGQVDFYRSLKIKVNAKDMSTGRKQSIKILLKFTESKARMLFLGPPLNKIYAKLITDGESALLINSKQRKYWQGDFKTLLQEMWDVNFDYSEFKRLLVDGIVPGKRLKKRGIQVSVEMDKESGKPGTIQISGRNILIKLRISNRKTRTGTLVFSVNLEKHEKAAGLDDLLSGD